MKRIKYDILTKTALGLFTIGEIPFNEATIFNFQNRIKRYEDKHGVNLFNKVFDDLTQQQLKELKLKTNIARTDSFMIDSNIKSYGRLQILIEVIKRLYSILDPNLKERISNKFKEYFNKGADKYIYELKGSDIPHEYEKISHLYYWFKQELPERYNKEKEYKHFIRVYNEHFAFNEEQKLEIKDSDDIVSDSLQSPDDEEATYRNKNGNKFRGHLVNLVETASKENPINLITDARVEPNNKDDSKILDESLFSLKNKMPELSELHFDGGYGSSSVDKKLEDLEIQGVQTAVRGRKPKSRFVINRGKNGVYKVTCPGGKTGISEFARKRYKVLFTGCGNCPKRSSCSAIQLKSGRAFYFTETDYKKHKRHRSLDAIPPDRRNIRANVEATGQELLRNTRDHKLKVRGRFKAKLFVFASVIGINFGRLYRYIRRDNGDPAKSGLKQLIYSKLASHFGKNQFNFNKIVSIWKLSFLMKKITKLIKFLSYKIKPIGLLQLGFL